jgi:hypothetical protein
MDWLLPEETPPEAGPQYLCKLAAGEVYMVLIWNQGQWRESRLPGPAFCVEKYCAITA